MHRSEAIERISKETRLRAAEVSDNVHVFIPILLILVGVWRHHKNSLLCREGNRRYFTSLMFQKQSKSCCIRMNRC